MAVERSIKIVLIGSENAGRTNLGDRLKYNTFKESPEPTIGASFLSKPITLVSEKKVVKAEIWDTAGKERFMSLIPMYLRSANAVGIVLAPDPKIKDPMEARNYLKAEARKYYDAAKKHITNDVPIYFITPIQQ